MNKDDVNTGSPAPETTLEASESQAENTEQGQEQTEGSSAPKANTQAVFDEALEAFVRSTEDSKKYARLCSDMGLDHFAVHGDLIYLQRFLDKIATTGKNYVRRAAFIQWMIDHAPIKEEAGKLTKDKTSKVWEQDGSKEELLEKAHAIAFWDYKPDTEQVNFGAMDYITALKAAHKKFQRENYHPVGNRVHDVMKKGAEFIDSLVGENASPA